MLPSDWPESLRQYIENHHGLPQSIERLAAGLSSAQVDRLHYPQYALILKGGVKPAEAYFYPHVAPVLRTAGIPIPELHFASNDGYWLLLEGIPQPLPRSRWRGDPQIAAVLARLHHLSIESMPHFPPDLGYKPAWNDSLSEQALACFDNSTAHALRPRLRDLRISSQVLFAPRCTISGDCNPLNWGLRADGSLVLFDWERYCFATPAIDLAISVGGLLNREQHAPVASYYLQSRPDYPVSLEQLRQEVLLAKVWVVVEFLSQYSNGNLQPDDTLTKLTSGFRDWLNSLGIL